MWFQNTRGTAAGIKKERKKEDKRLDFCFDWGMAIPLLLPKLELPGILDALEVHLVVAPEQIELWNRLVCEHHYLKNANLVGEQLRYALTYEGQWVALLGWSAASFHLKDREAWLEWSNLQRRSRLHLLAQNSRFVVLVKRTQWPNLASRSLGLVCRRLSQDWQQAYGHPIAAVESFVDSQLFRGTAYKATGWKLLGQTDGFGRVAEDFYTRHDRPKQLWVKSLVAEAPALLSAAVLSPPWQAYEKPCCGISCEDLPSLFDRFRGLTDTRKGQGKRHRLATLYSIIACAKLSGIPLVFNHSQDCWTPEARAGPMAAPRTLGTSPRGHPTAASRAIILAPREDHRSCAPANRPASRPSTSPPTG